MQDARVAGEEDCAQCAICENRGGEAGEEGARGLSRGGECAGLGLRLQADFEYVKGVADEYGGCAGEAELDVGLEVVFAGAM